MAEEVVTDGGVSLEAAALELLGGGPTPSPAAEPAKESSPTLEEEAARVEAELLASEDGKAKDPEKPQEKPAEADPVQALIDTKYGGDRQKFVDGLHEQWKSASKLHDEVRQLKEALLTAKQEPEEIDLSTHPDISRLETRINSYDSEIKEHQQEQQRLIAEANKYQTEIYKLQGKLDVKEDPLEKRELQADIRERERSIRDLAKEYKDADASIRKLKNDKESLSEQREAVESKIHQAQQQKLTQELANKQYQVQELDKFNKAVDAESKDYGIDGELKEYLRGLLKSEASYFIRNLPPDQTEGIDLPEFVKARLKVHAGMLKLGEKKEFKQKSDEKLQVTAKTPASAPPKPAAPASPIASPKKWTAEFARARAAKLLP